MTAITSKSETVSTDDYAPDPQTCSFCGKPPADVKIMIAGPKGYICDKCIVLCLNLFIEWGSTEKIKSIQAQS